MPRSGASSPHIQVSFNIDLSRSRRALNAYAWDKRGFRSTDDDLLTRRRTSVDHSEAAKTVVCGSSGILLCIEGNGYMVHVEDTWCRRDKGMQDEWESEKMWATLGPSDHATQRKSQNRLRRKRRPVGPPTLRI